MSNLARPIRSFFRAVQTRSGSCVPRIRNLGGRYAAVLSANHGPAVSGRTVFSAVCADEKLEKTAKLLMALKGQKVKLLTSQEWRI